MPMTGYMSVIYNTMIVLEKSIYINSLRVAPTFHEAETIVSARSSNASEVPRTRQDRHSIAKKTANNLLRLNLQSLSKTL